MPTEITADGEIERRGPREATLETVLTTAFRLLIDEGAHAITAQRIHQETGVARTTIYRHWPEPADLIRTMFDRAVAGRGIPSFTGELRVDLEIAVGSLVQRFNKRPVRALFGALVEHGRRDADAGDIAADYVRGLLTPVSEAVAQGIDRGELVDGDLHAMVDELSATLFMRHVLLGQHVDDDDAQGVIDAFLRRHSAER